MENKSWKNSEQLVNVKVYIGGKDVSYIALELIQEYGQHHEFTIVMDYDVFGHKFMDNPLKEIELLGKRVTMDFSHGDSDENVFQFVGLVTDMKLKAEEGQHGQLILSGYSPTVLLDRGKRYQAYADTSLSSVFEGITENLNSTQLRKLNDPVYKDPIDFLMQYNETDWEFLQRISYLFGENMFYSGTELLFGQYPEWRSIPITYDKELQTMEFCSKLLHNDFTYYQYMSDSDRTLEKSSTLSVRKSFNFITKAKGQADAFVHTKPLRVPSEAVVGDPFEITEMMHRRNERTAAQTIIMKGQAKTYLPFMGRIIEVLLPETMNDLPIVGTYRIIKAVHLIDQNNRYTNYFEGAPAQLGTVPIAEPYMPKADSVQAIVKSNADPQGIGRVQVEFPFEQGQYSYWLRVMTPDAGSSGKEPTNRGMVFIPEEGDQVMVGFELGDPNRPYVMGSLFHGANGKGGGSNNAERSIITKSGIKIVFNDDQKSLHIEDPSGNTWDMDGNGNIAVNAPKNMTFTVGEDLTFSVGKNIKTIAGEDIATEAGKDIKVDAGNDIDINAINNINEFSDERMEFVENKYRIDSDIIEENAGGISYYSSEEDLKLQSKKSVQINSGEKTNLY